MNRFFKFIGLLLILVVFNYVWISYFFKEQIVVIKQGETLNEDIILNEGKAIFEKNSILNGDIVIEEGEIYLAEGAKILGSIELDHGSIFTNKNTEIQGAITLEEGEIKLIEMGRLGGEIFAKKGDILIGKNSILEKNVSLNEGYIKLEENVEVKGDVTLNEAEMEKHSSAKILGAKPPVYATYDWPEALQYFDILPEAHKNQVGYIMLTKEKNGLIREDGIISGKQYFDSIYDYKDGNLIKADFSDPNLLETFFKKAKSFFDGVPERRMVYFNVGVTTEDFAHDENFADIYLPAKGSGTLILHEMAHVMDFKYDYSDFHEPKFPWTKEDAVSSYGATHPGEDFAEAYRLYVLNQKGFLELIKENPERQKKYDYLKKYVFENKF